MEFTDFCLWLHPESRGPGPEKVSDFAPHERVVEGRCGRS